MRIAALGTTAKAVSEAAGMSQSNFHDIITGSTDPRATTLRRIETALGVPEGWLSQPEDMEKMGAEAGALPPPEWLKEEEAGDDADSQ